MKLIKYTVIVALIVLIALYAFKKEPHAKEKKSRPINQVSFQASDTDQKIQNNIQTNTLVNPTAELIKEIEELTPIKPDKKADPDLDYVTAYRDWQYFANCYTDIEDFQNDREPLDTLAARFENNPREAQSEPTQEQNSIYQKHADICQTMINDVGDDKDNYYQIMHKLGARFRSITPKTDEAKQLKHALEMVHRLKFFKNEYLDSTFPVSTLSNEQSNGINQRIEDLSDQLITVYENTDELTQEHTLMIQELSNEIELLRKNLLNSRTINNNEMLSKEKQLDGYLNSIDDYLHKIQSPDAFLILTSELYNSDYYQKESTILQKMKSQTGINDPYYVRILNRLVMPLVACSMNYPCGPESDYMMSYCLGLRDSMFMQACGKDLTDFYFNFYIGMNQMSDVDNYFNYIVNRYAN